MLLYSATHKPDIRFFYLYIELFLTFQVVELRRKARLWKERSPGNRSRDYKNQEPPSDVKAAAYSAVLLNQNSKIDPGASSMHR